MCGGLQHTVPRQTMAGSAHIHKNDNSRFCMIQLNFVHHKNITPAMLHRLHNTKSPQYPKCDQDGATYHLAWAHTQIHCYQEQVAGIYRERLHFFLGIGVPLVKSPTKQNLVISLYF